MCACSLPPVAAAQELHSLLDLAIELRDRLGLFLKPRTAAGRSSLRTPSFRG
jgi:hypothetical protein